MHTQDIALITQGLTDTLKDFEYETKLAYDQIVKPRFNQAPTSSNRLPDILHACMMWCFAHIDILSQYWKGVRKKPGDQSIWMVDFIEHYMGYPRDAASMAVHMWRHNMMHTGNPRELYDPDRKIRLRWLLHWGEGEMSRSAHFVLTSGNPQKIDMTLFHLIEDLTKAQGKYFQELSGNPDLIEKFKNADKLIREVRLPTF